MGWVQQAENELEAFAHLERNWDSYGGYPPTEMALKNARSFLQGVYASFPQSQSPFIAPRADGGIQIEWGTKPLEIAVHVDYLGCMGYLLIEEREGKPEYKEAKATEEEILSLVALVVV